MSAAIDFDKCFKALTGHDPFPWQRQLYERLMAGRVPRTCDIPTGLGKSEKPRSLLGRREQWGESEMSVTRA